MTYNVDENGFYGEQIILIICLLTADHADSGIVQTKYSAVFLFCFIEIDNFLHRTIKNKTESIEGRCSDGLSVLHAVDALEEDT